MASSDRTLNTPPSQFNNNGPADSGVPPRQTNMGLAAHIFSELLKMGVRECVVCAGARNSPFILLFEEVSGKQFKVYHFFEERSAAFFCLGRMQLTGQPVAVFTTSGTAAAELLPAAVEATYFGLPLIMVTADRPARFRSSGAPQAIVQLGLFSYYIERDYDISVDHYELEWGGLSFRKPVHINVCFDEPLLDAPPTLLSTLPLNLGEVLDKEKVSPRRRLFFSEDVDLKPAIQFLAERKVLVIVGTLARGDQQWVVPFLEKLGAPIYAEAISQLRGHPRLNHLLIRSGESLINGAFREGLLDGVLRIGGVPTLRLWRDLESTLRDIPVLSFVGVPFSGLSRPSLCVEGIELLPNCCSSEYGEKSYEEFLIQDQTRFTFLQKLFYQFPYAEPSMIHHLSRVIGDERVYLGNSLPIREWDFAADYTQRPEAVSGNRGANGIDGQLSTYFGWAEPGVPTWGLFGDLTTLYDLAAPWVVDQLGSVDLRLVVINNFGGQIFRRMFGHPAFLNSHTLDFASWAQMWKWNYRCWKKIPSVEMAMKDADPFGLEFSSREVIEIRPSLEQTEEFWKAHDSLWS